MDIIEFWKYVLAQDADKIRAFFCRDGYVNWRCANLHFLMPFLNHKPLCYGSLLLPCRNKPLYHPHSSIMEFFRLGA